ncbi:MAG: RrF2 family transcriptional regulator [Clostridia bacterium]|nr:RrF2 family transcriptional regulator [Clostridia bacterium]
MKISTRGRYALRVMVDLAENGNGNLVPLKDIAARQGVSQKYLESIMTELSKADMFGVHNGKGGGYRLNRPPEEYTVGEILRVTEKDLAPVACLEKTASSCPREKSCRTLPMWKKFYELINGFFDGVTLSDLMLKDGK